MNRTLRIGIFAGILSITAVFPVYAQNNNVEVNLDVLNELSRHRYTPPGSSQTIRLRPPGSAPVEPLTPIERPVEKKVIRQKPIMDGPLPELVVKPLKEKRIFKEAAPLPPKKPENRKAAAPAKEAKEEIKAVDVRTAPVVKPRQETDLATILDQDFDLDLTDGVHSNTEQASGVPIPKKRPRKVSVPQSFVEEIRARQQADPAPVAAAAPVKPVASNPLKEERNQGLFRNAQVIDLSEKDVLKEELKKPSAKEVLASIESNVPEEPQAKDVEIESAEGSETITLGYLPGVSEVPQDIAESLKTQIIQMKNTYPGGHISIQAFASPDEEGLSSARRISLARALNIRSLMLDLNVDPKMIDIRALGSNTDRKPYDRVDIMFGANAGS